MLAAEPNFGFVSCVAPRLLYPAPDDGPLFTSFGLGGKNEEYTKFKDASSCRCSRIFASPAKRTLKGETAMTAPSTD
jgi:hypothetical protein